MEATDNVVLTLKIPRSDVVFIHDVLMGCQFSGAQMLQAASIISGLKPGLTAQPAAAPKVEAPAAAAPPAPAPKPLRDVPPVPAPAPVLHKGGKPKRKR